MPTRLGRPVAKVIRSTYHERFDDHPHRPDRGHNGDDIEAYLVEPTEAATPRGGVVVIHHMPGYDRGTKEIARRIGELGYNV